MEVLAHFQMDNTYPPPKPTANSDIFLFRYSLI